MNLVADVLGPGTEFSVTPHHAPPTRVHHSSRCASSGAGPSANLFPRQHPAGCPFTLFERMASHHEHQRASTIVGAYILGPERTFMHASPP